MRSPFDALITEKSLSFIATRRNRDLMELIADDRVEHTVPLKNMCAKITPELAEEILQVVSVLGCTKRQFLEAAFIDAVARAKQIMESEGVFASLDELAGPVDGSCLVAEVVED